MIWIIAWKNIWRNRTRSIVVVLAIAFGLWGGVFSSAVMKGTGEERVKEAVDRETSHIQIHNPDFIEDNDLKSIIPDSGPIESALDTMKTIDAWSPRLKMTAMAASANAATGIIVIGVDPDKELQVTEIHSLIKDTAGTWFKNYKGIPIVIGVTLAKKMKIHLHSKIVLTFQDKDGNLTGSAFRVCGIYKTNNSIFDEMNVFVQRSDLSPMLGFDDKACHEIAIKLKDASNISNVQTNLKSHFPKLLVQNWKEVDPLSGILNDFMDLYLYLFMGIILLALGFGIINTMLMSILERTRELGMLTAIGMNKGRVFSMIMLESVFLSFTGGIAGIIMGILLVALTHTTGIDLSSFTEGFEKLGYNPILYPSLDYLFFVNLSVLVILTGILASVYPARHALRLNPATAIRND